MPAAISCCQISPWSTTWTPSFSALVSLAAPTSAPVISRSVFAETDVAVVAPAFSHSRWKVGRGTFSPERGSLIAPVTTTVLPASGASDATTGGRSSPRTQPRQFRAQARQVLDQRRGHLRTDVLHRDECLLARVGHLLQ